MSAKIYTFEEVQKIWDEVYGSSDDPNCLLRDMSRTQKEVEEANLKFEKLLNEGGWTSDMWMEELFARI